MVDPPEHLPGFGLRSSRRRKIGPSRLHGQVERRTFDYRGHGTQSLFAALECGDRQDHR